MRLHDAAFIRLDGEREARIKHLESEIARLRLTDAEREAVERTRIAFRDMDHNAMTMQQLEDYEALCGLLERMGGDHANRP